MELQQALSLCCCAVWTRNGWWWKRC